MRLKEASHADCSQRGSQNDEQNDDLRLDSPQLVIGMCGLWNLTISVIAVL